MADFKATFIHIAELLNPRVPTRALYFIAALLWSYASVKLLTIGLTTVQNADSHMGLLLLAGLILYFPFYYFVFFRINRKHSKRIMLKTRKYNCLFGFFDVKSYLIMTLMISMGIAAKKIPGIPPIPVAVLYIALGLSLGSSGIYFLVAGIFNHWMKNKLLNPKIS